MRSTIRKSEKNPPKKKPGRKPKGGRVYTVKLADDVASYYRQLGGGYLTRGIEIAARFKGEPK